MADFYEIHRVAINKANGRIRSGDGWNVALIEPLPLITLKPSNIIPTVKYVTFRAMPDGRLEPAGVGDRQTIAEWQERYRNTPAESFTWYPKF